MNHKTLFNQMKNSWGWRETWQQSRQVLHCWTQILSVAYAIPQMLAIYCPQQWDKATRMDAMEKGKYYYRRAGEIYHATVFRQC